MHSLSKRSIALLKCIILLLVLNGCRVYVPTRVPTSESSFTAQDLFIAPSAFPEGWGAEPPFEMAGPIVGESEEWIRLARTFYGHNTLANQRIYGYRDQAKAAEAFESLSNRFFSSNEFISTWKTPSELQYQSRYSDRFHLACAATASNYVCQALGQYEKYVIRIHIPMEPHTNIDYDALEFLLKAMEERVSSYLELEKRNP